MIAEFFYFLFTYPRNLAGSSRKSASHACSDAKRDEQSIEIWKKNIVMYDAKTELPGHITDSEFSGISRRSALNYKTPNWG